MKRPVKTGLLTCLAKDRKEEKTDGGAGADAGYAGPHGPGTGGQRVGHRGAGGDPGSKH